MPDGSEPARSLRITVISDTWQPVTYDTDSKGRAQLSDIRGLDSNCTVTIESDGQSYGTTTLRFKMDSRAMYLPIFLNPVRPGVATPIGPPVVGVAELRKPTDEALKARSRGLRASSKGDLNEAAAQFQRALSNFPEFPDALNDLGAILLKTGDLDRAAEMLSRAADLAPGLLVARLNLGIVWTRQHKYGEAVELLQRVRLQNPRSSEVLVPLADALAGQGRFDEAAQYLLHALHTGGLTGKERGRIHYKYGMILFWMQNYSSAVKELSQAVRRLPEDPGAHLQLGAAAFRARDLKLAERELHTAYRLGGADVASAQLLIGQIHCEWQQTTAAKRAFEQFLADRPNAPESSQVRALLLILK